MSAADALTRRGFLQAGAAAGSACWLAPRAYAADSEGAARPLAGFIVSDAHFGWRHDQQPPPEVQRQMTERILTHFPDLDVFIDTGDVHHGNLRGEEGASARADWLDCIANAPHRSPVFFVGGNHDMMSTAEMDSEWRCCELASMDCRPYYSFDLAGVHFLSLPQMMRAVYMNRESLEWAALDLELNRDKTTIILSHNNVLGTTGPYEEGYRGIVNSEELLTLLARFPNVVGWMHGHNHNYQVIEKHGRLYVSNGRIGGFDPSANAPGGPYGLGGIYFEVSPDALSVRSWSAEREDFLDDLGIADTSGRLERRTTLDRTAPSEYAYGFGGAREGMRVPVYHHVVGGSREAFVARATGRDFNDDPGVHMYMERGRQRETPHRQLMGADVTGQAPWEWAEPGIRLLPTSAPSDTTRVTVPQQGMGAAIYYPLRPGARLRMVLALDAAVEGISIRPEVRVLDRFRNELAGVGSEEARLREGKQEQEWTFTLPGLVEYDHIYEDAGNDAVTHAMIHMEVRGLIAPLTIARITLEQLGQDGGALEPALVLDGVPHAPASTRAGIGHVPLPDCDALREVAEIRIGSGDRLTWVVRTRAPVAQVRHAPGRLVNGTLEVGPIRNPWLRVPEISVAFLDAATPVRSVRMHLLERASLRDEDGDLCVTLQEAMDGAELRVQPSAAIEDVHGAVRWDREGDQVVAYAGVGSEVRFRCKRAG